MCARCKKALTWNPNAAETEAALASVANEREQASRVKRGDRGAPIQWLFYCQKASLKYLQFVQKHLKVSRILHCKFNLKAHTWNNTKISS